jgi:hypothetical protein
VLAEERLKRRRRIESNEGGRGRKGAELHQKTEGEVRASG